MARSGCPATGLSLALGAAQKDTGGGERCGHIARARQRRCRCQCPSLARRAAVSVRFSVHYSSGLFLSLSLSLALSPMRAICIKRQCVGQEVRDRKHESLCHRTPAPRRAAPCFPAPSTEHRVPRTPTVRAFCALCLELFPFLSSCFFRFSSTDSFSNFAFSLMHMLFSTKTKSFS